MHLRSSWMSERCWENETSTMRRMMVDRCFSAQPHPQVSLIVTALPAVEGVSTNQEKKILAIKKSKRKRCRWTWTRRKTENESPGNLRESLCGTGSSCIQKPKEIASIDLPVVVVADLHSDSNTTILCTIGRVKRNTDMIHGVMRARRSSMTASLLKSEVHSHTVQSIPTITHTFCEWMVWIRIGTWA